MKKSILTLAALVLMLSLPLTGCKGADTKGTVVSGSDSTPTVSEESLSIGKSEGNTYVNEFFGIKCTLDSEWEFKTAEEIKAINNFTGDLIKDEDVKKMLENGNSTFTDMYASKNQMLDTVSIAIENASIYGLAATEADYVKAAMPQLKTALESGGFVISSVADEDITFAGKEHKAIRVKGSYQGVNLEELLVVVKKGSYFCCIGLASYTGADLNALAASFTAN